MILTDLYRRKISPYSSVVANNKESRDRLDSAQEAIIQALPEEKKPLIDASQDAFMTLIMDEAEAAFAEGVRFGVRLMMEIFYRDGGDENASNS